MMAFSARPGRRLRRFGLALSLALALVPAVAVGSAEARHAGATGRGTAYLNYYAPFYYMAGNGPGYDTIICFDSDTSGRLIYYSSGAGSCHQGLDGTRYSFTQVQSYYGGNYDPNPVVGILSYWCDYTGCG